MRPHLSNLVWDIFRRTDLGHRLWLRRRYGIPLGSSLRYPRPRPAWAVLREHSEVEEAAREVQELGLPALGLREKFWDALAAVGAVLASTTPADAVLDAGAETYSPILPWLARYRYRRLVGCNLAFHARTRSGPIVYEPGDLTRTGYADGEFAAVTCMSVIEHGVDVALFFAEMRRILRPGGLLVVSTDYWQDPLDTGGRTLFGVPQKVFDRREIEAAVVQARRASFIPLAPPEFGCRDKVVQWDGLAYTFLLMTFRHQPPGHA